MKSWPYVDDDFNEQQRPFGTLLKNAFNRGWWEEDKYLKVVAGAHLVPRDERNKITNFKGFFVSSPVNQSYNYKKYGGIGRLQYWIGYIDTENTASSFYFNTEWPKIYPFFDRGLLRGKVSWGVDAIDITSLIMEEFDSFDVFMNWKGVPWGDEK